MTTINDLSLPALAKGCLKERRALSEDGVVQDETIELSPGTHLDFSIERRP